MRNRLIDQIPSFRAAGFFSLLLFILLAVTAFPAQPRASNTVDVQLVLAIDCSYSVDAREYELQRSGLAAAFRNDEVLRAIQSGPHRSIAVAVVQ